MSEEYGENYVGCHRDCKDIVFDDKGKEYVDCMISCFGNLKNFGFGFGFFLKGVW